VRERGRGKKKRNKIGNVEKLQKKSQYSYSLPLLFLAAKTAENHDHSPILNGKHVV